MPLLMTERAALLLTERQQQNQRLKLIAPQDKLIDANPVCADAASQVSIVDPELACIPPLLQSCCGAPQRRDGDVPQRG